jgi:hypothetical protein
MYVFARAREEAAGERKMLLKLIFHFAIKTYRASHHLVSQEILHKRTLGLENETHTCKTRF